MDEDNKLKKKDLDKLLSKMESAGELTVSDKELLKLRDADPNLTVVETAEYFDWNKSRGEYYNIVTGKNFDKDRVASFDDYADIMRVNTKVLGMYGKSYTLEGPLECIIGGVKGDPAKPDFGKLKLRVTTNNGESINLSDYNMSVSARVKEFYSVDKGLRVSEESHPFNSVSMIAKLSGNGDIALVYRTTFKGREKVGSRLYLRTPEGESRILGKEENSSIIDFMDYLRLVHKDAFKETSCKVSELGHRPDYMDLYA